MDEVAWTPHEVPDGEEHVAVAYTPQIHEVERYRLPSEPVTSVLQTALRTVVAAVLLVAEGTYVLLVTLLDGWLVVLLLPLQTKPIFGKDIHLPLFKLIGDGSLFVIVA